MRKWNICVPMMTLLLVLTACGGGETSPAVDLRDQYHDCGGCEMEAVVRCEQEGLAWEASLRCVYFPDAPSTVEVLAPEEIAGVKAIVDESEWSLEYEGDVLNAGPLSREEISPAVCLPRLMSALRDGWLLEENQEDWNGVPCQRVTVDQSGQQDGKIISTIWLNLDGAAPVRGEIAVDGVTILSADFSSFSFTNEPENPEN